MRILVIGHSVVDKVHYKGEVKRSPGGIYFSLLGFLANSYDAEIHLVTSFAEKHYSLFGEVFRHVKFFVSPEAERMPVNHLYIKDNEEREEVYEYIPGKLNIDAVGNLDIYDGIYINMVSGFEIGINELYQLRQSFQGPIYIDVHTLSRGVNEDQQRFFRPIPHPEVWYGNADFIQANESEILTLGTENETRDEITENILSVGVSGVIVTNEKNGAAIYYYEEEKRSFSFSDRALRSAIPCVGCGDFFGAVFFSAWLKEKSFEKALKKGVTAAGLFIKYRNNYKKINKELNERFD